MPKHLFLSYNSRDRGAVDSIRQLLNLRNVDVFFDCIDLTPGRDWFDELEIALKDVRGVAVFFGPAGLGMVQKRELHVALSRQVEEERSRKSFPVVPVMLPGSRPEDLPAFCALNTWLDLRKGGAEAEEQLDRLVRSFHKDSGGSVDILPAVRSSICPYRALEVFREEDALLFFGREPASQALLKKVLACPLVAVVGASGSGKSSLAQAGLIPLLRQQRPPADVWEVIIAKPQAEPYYEIAVQLAALWLAPDHTRADRVAEARKIEAGLRAKQTKLSDYLKQALEALRPTGTTRLLIILDQFEQIFTHGLTTEERSDLIESLLEAIAGPTAVAKLLITLRADFVQPALSLGADFVEKYQDGIWFVGPMRETELREAIEGPARRVGLGFEAGLVETIIQDLGKEPGELALLEFAMTELWNRRRSAKVGANEELTLDAYVQIGRVHGAIASRAESLLPSSKRMLEELERALLRLVHVAEAGTGAGADVRRVVRRSELSPENWQALEKLVEARLLVASSSEGETPVIQLAHEALIRHWSWLSGRIGAKRDFLVWRQNFQVFLEAWQKYGETALLPPQLQLEAEEIIKHHGTDLNDLEKGLIDAGGSRRAKLQRRIRIAVLILITLISAALGYAYWSTTPEYVAREVMYQAETLVKSDSANKDWFEVLALVDREEAWKQGALLYDRGDIAIALQGILSAIRRQHRIEAGLTLWEGLQPDLHRFADSWQPLLVALVASSAPDPETCQLLQQKSIEDRQGFKRLLSEGSGSFLYISQSLIQCGAYETLRSFPFNRQDSLNRLYACLKLQDEDCTREALAAAEIQYASGYFGLEGSAFFSAMPTEARTSEAFRKFASKYPLGHVLTSKQDPNPECRANPFPVFEAYQTTGLHMDFARLSRADSLLLQALEDEFKEYLSDCHNRRAYPQAFIDLSLELGEIATEPLTTCFSSDRQNAFPTISPGSSSAILLTRISRELRSRGSVEKAVEVAWSAIAASKGSSRPPHIDWEDPRLKVEELVPGYTADFAIEAGPTIERLQRETAGAPEKAAWDLEILRWKIRARSGADTRAILSEAKSTKRYQDSLLVLVDAAANWSAFDPQLASQLADLAEDWVDEIPVRDRPVVYLQLSIFHSRRHEFSRALSLSHKLTSGNQQFAAFIQLTREYAIFKGQAQADWWPRMPTPRFLYF